MTKQKDLLVIGHPRSGTQFTSFALQRIGVMAGHEIMGPDGVVSWMAAFDGIGGEWTTARGDRVVVEPRPHPRTFRHVWHVVRHPLDVIASTMTEDGRSWSIRASKLPRLAAALKNAEDAAERGESAAWMIEAAAISWLDWNEACSAQAEWRFRVEDFRSWLPEAAARIGLTALPDMALFDIKTDTNSRPHGSVSWDALKELTTQTTYGEVRQLAAEYGYRLS